MTDRASLLTKSADRLRRACFGNVSHSAEVQKSDLARVLDDYDRLRQAVSVMPEGFRTAIEAALDGAFGDSQYLFRQDEKWDEQRALYMAEIAAEYSKGTGS